MKYLFLILACLSGTLSYATDFFPKDITQKDGGTSAGDGGHSVWCESSPSTAELLDLYEARRYYHFEPSLIFDSQPASIHRAGLYLLDLFTLELRAIDALGSPHPFVKLISELALNENFGLDFDFQTSVLTQDPGGSILPIPGDCQVLQAGRRLRAEGKVRFEVNRNLMKMMPQVDQAALFVHEIAHEWFNQKMTRSTLAERQTVVYLFAPDEFRQRNLEAFKLLIKSKQALNPNSFR